jgi:hypothetical protein
MKIDTKLFGNRILISIIILVFILGLVSGIAIQNLFEKRLQHETQEPSIPQIQESITQTIKDEDWVTIQEFSNPDGTQGTISTEEFHISSNYWRVIFEAEALERAKYVGFNMHIIPVDYEDEGYIAPKTCEKTCYGIARTRIYYIYEGPGDFYIEITPWNLKSWSIKVQTQE